MSLQYAAIELLIKNEESNVRRKRKTILLGLFSLANDRCRIFA